MGLVLQLVETGADKPDTRKCSIDVLGIDHPRDLRDIANLGLMLAEARQLLTVSVALPPFFPSEGECGGSA